MADGSPGWHTERVRLYVITRAGASRGLLGRDDIEAVVRRVEERVAALPASMDYRTFLRAIARLADEELDHALIARMLVSEAVKEDGLAVLWDWHMHRLTGLAARQLRGCPTIEGPEELAHAALASAAARLDGFIPRPSFRAWVSRILVNRVWSALRAYRLRRARLGEVRLDGVAEPVAEPIQDDDIDRTHIYRRAGLSPSEAAVFEATYHGDAPEKIARARGLQRRMIRQILYTARRKLRRYLVEAGGVL
jgi:RNA polymerase sigma factor (sigma-70 family)